MFNIDKDVRIDRLRREAAEVVSFCSKDYPIVVDVVKYLLDSLDDVFPLRKSIGDTVDFKEMLDKKYKA